MLQEGYTSDKSSTEESGRAAKSTWDVEDRETEKQKNFEWMHHYCQNWQNRTYQSPVSIANLMKYDHKEFTYVYAWKLAEICN